MQIALFDTCTIGSVVIGQTDSFGVEWYFLGIDGWEAQQSTAQLTQKGAADGGFASPAWLSGRTFTVTGAIVAGDRPSLVAAKDRLATAASIFPAPVTVTEGGNVRYSIAQRQSEITYTDQSDTVTEFSVTFIAEDPRRFGTPLSVSTFLPAATGGWTFPFTFPLAIASTVIAGTCSAFNVGNANGPVTMRIDGPVVAPIITHVGSGAQLVFASSYSLLAGNWLEIDMDNRTVLENGQSERLVYMTSYGWSQFEPGENVWAFTNAGSYNSSAKLTVAPVPAWQ